MLHLFDAIGIELEYMIVDRDTLSVRPVADRIIHRLAGSYESEVENGELAWSNELVLHVIELKTNGPAASLRGLADLFQNDVRQINDVAAEHGAALLPTGAHPWMKPDAETRLWPHEYSPVYHAFNRIFDCRGHGWSNLQATHLNLPFADDQEFGRLHAAIRLLLPILPGLAASTPILDGRLKGLADARLDTYRHNADRIPAVTGTVIPEPVFTQDEYDATILQPLYRAIAPHDPEGILQYEWLNARGAIARFDRNAIEIRVLDIQECPAADLAIAGLIVAVLKALCEERFGDYAGLKAWRTEPLVEIFDAAVRHGDGTVIADRQYLRLFGRDEAPCTVGELWRHLFETVAPDIDDAAMAPLETYVTHGCLSRRIRTAVGERCTPDRLIAVYRELRDSLHNGRMFVPDAH